MAIPSEPMAAPAEPIQQISPKRKIPGIPDYWQQFFVCVIFHMILPLSPIIIDLWLKNPFSEKSIILAASMYSISIGVSSRNILLFGAATVISLILAVAFGFISAPQTPSNLIPSNLGLITIICTISIFISHIFERYNRHVVGREPFLNFMAQNKG